MGIRALAVTAVVLSVAGCASFNPYIQHSRSIDSTAQAQCIGGSRHTATDAKITKDTSKEEIKDRSPNHAEPGLAYACDMILRLEAARAQIAGTRSGVAASLFPMAGIIASNAARGINAPTSTALAATGFAGYSAVSTLAQPDRLKAYDAGLTSLNCAVGAYEVAVQRASLQSAQKPLLNAMLTEAQEQIENAISAHQSENSVLTWLRSQKQVVEAIRESLIDGNVGSYLGAQLSDFTRRTIAAVNAQVTSTMPDNKSLAGDTLSFFQSPSVAYLINPSDPPTPARRSSLFDIIYGTPRPSDLDQVKQTMDRLLRLYETFLQEKIKTQNLDLNACKYAEVNGMAFQAATAKLMLGPGDTLSGQMITLAQGKAWSTQVTGGIAPYSTSFIDTGSDNSMSADIDLAKGVAMLKISATNTTPLGDYRLVVGDASGRYAKGMTVRVVAP